VLQYLGTAPQTVTAWGISASKMKKPPTKPKPASKAPTGTISATPLFAANLAPCSTFSVILPSIPQGGKGSKAVWKLGSKTNKSKKYIIKPGSKSIHSTVKKPFGGLTLFVGNNVNTRINLDCATGISPGQIYGMFRVIRLEDADGNRICPSTPPPNCTIITSPTCITFRYNGGNCVTASNSQRRGTSYNCSDSGVPCTGSVKVVFSRTPSLTQKFYWTTVPVGTPFTLCAPAGCSNLGPALYAFIFNGSTQIECVQIDTSCSAALIRGETFGGLQLVDYTK
jgi:hypothetical protein